MGSSRASTPAARRRTAARRNAGAATRRPAQRPAARKPATKPAPKRAPTNPSKRGAPRARKPAPRRKQAAKSPAAPLRARLPRILAIAVAVVAVVAAGYLLWFRNSSLVAVENLEVAGLAGPEADEARTALTRAAGEMTTLNVDEGALRAAVAGLPTVVDVEADASFPHDLVLTVTERPPVLLARAGGRVAAVAGDGTVLTGVDPGDAKLPAITVEDLPSKGKLTGDALEVARVMGAAPGALRDLVQDVAVGPPEGVQVTVRGDVPVYFGGGEQAAEKWAAAAAVLADPKIETLTYVDVRVPGRPAIGGAAPAASGDTTTDATEPETTAMTPAGP